MITEIVIINIMFILNLKHIQHSKLRIELIDVINRYKFNLGSHRLQYQILNRITPESRLVQTKDLGHSHNYKLIQIKLEKYKQN